MSTTTWYKIGGYKQDIEPVEVEKETNTSVWVKGYGRMQKQSQYYTFFRELKDAYLSAVNKYKDKIRLSQESLKRAQDGLNALIGQYPEMCDATGDAMEDKEMD